MMKHTLALITTLLLTLLATSHAAPPAVVLAGGQALAAAKPNIVIIFSDWAGDYLRERAMAKQPFFLYLAYNAPHFPIEPPDDWLAKVKARAHAGVIA